MEIANIDIYESKDTLYIKCLDGRLINISGDDIEKVKIVINHLNEGKFLKELESNEITKKEANEIITFLYQNGVINKKERVIDKQFNIGFLGSEILFKLLIDKLPFSNIIRITSEGDLNGITLLLISCSLFENFALLKRISAISYKNNIEILYSEISPTTFTIGPLIIPKLHTPSLGCFMQRKLVNVKDPYLYSQFIFSKHKKKIKKSNIQDYPYFSASFELMVEEINRYIKFNGEVSQHLIAKSMTINFFDYSIENSRILKDPTSPLFISTPFAPFNG